MVEGRIIMHNISQIKLLGKLLLPSCDLSDLFFYCSATIVAFQTVYLHVISLCPLMCVMTTSRWGKPAVLQKKGESISTWQCWLPLMPVMFHTCNQYITDGKLML